MRFVKIYLLPNLEKQKTYFKVGHFLWKLNFSLSKFENKNHNTLAIFSFRKKKVSKKAASSIKKFRMAEYLNEV